MADTPSAQSSVRSALVQRAAEVLCRAQLLPGPHDADREVAAEMLEAAGFGRLEEQIGVADELVAYADHSWACDVKQYSGPDRKCTCGLQGVLGRWESFDAR